MANELNIGITLAYSDNGVTLNRSESFSVDIAGNAIGHAIQEVTTNEALVIPAAMGTVAFVFIKNLHASSYLNIGPATGRTDMQLLAGQSMLFRLTSGTSIYCAAETGTVEVEYIVFEL